MPAQPSVDFSSSEVPFLGHDMGLCMKYKPDRLCQLDLVAKQDSLSGKDISFRLGRLVGLVDSLCSR